MFMLAGCSDIEYSNQNLDTNTSIDNNTTDDNSSASSNITGQFLDAYVENMNYTCSSGAAGVTDINGSYTCSTGDDVTFFLGSNNIATIAIQESVITPYTLFPASLDSALNLARLLQSLDDDSNLTNSVISLDKTLESLLPQNLDFSSSTFENDVEIALNIDLISANDAQVRLNSSILAEGGTLPPNSTPPVANAGTDLNVSVNTMITLDGSSSSATSYSWSFISKPVNSTAILLSYTTVAPTFVADKNGTYEVELIVNGDDINYDSDRVIIIVTDPENPIVVIPPVDSTNNTPIIDVVNSVDVYENQISALTISASDDDNDTLTYSIYGTDSDSFNVDPFSGVVTFVNLPDYEIKNLYSITAKVSDSNVSDEQDITINILNIIEKPTLSDTTLSLNENSAIGTNVGQVTIVTHGDEAITIFTLSGDDSNNFSIDTSGVVTATVSFDYELKTSYSLSVSAISPIGTSEIINLNINITDVVDKVPVLVDTTLSFREDAIAGDVVGDVTIDNEGDSLISSITLAGTGSTNFEIDTDGELKVKAGASFDYEITDEYNITAQATNSTGLSNIVNIYLRVNNVIDEVPIIADSIGSLDENATLGTSLGTLNIIDIGDSAIINIDLNGTGNDYFSIANNGDITLVVADILDFESVPSYSLTAIATNTAGDSNSVTITITVRNIDEITILQNTSMSIMENELANAVVGSILIDTSSNDAGDSVITDITLSGSGNTNFVSDTDGQITLSPTSSIDYETTTSYTLGAVATNTAGVSLSATITIAIEDYVFNPTQIAKIYASDAEIDDSFGYSIAISGDYILVGAPYEDPGAVSDAGSAYLFKKDANGSVTQIAKLLPSTSKAEEYFGFCVAMDGSVMIVGAPESSNASGDVYIFIVDANDSVSLPAQQIDLGAFASNGDGFASSVDVSGDYIIIGAPGKASAHLYKLDVNKSAILVDNISESLTVADKYASKVAIDGTNFVIGAQDNDISYLNDGNAYVYKIDTLTDLASRIDSIFSPSPTDDNDYFGSSVDISGNYVVVGAYGIDSVETDAGRAFLFEIDAGATAVTHVDTFEPDSTPDNLNAGDYFGSSIAIDGEYIVVGAKYKDFSDINTTNNAGSAYIYHIDTSSDTTTLIKKLDSITPNTNDEFATSVAIDGDFMIVGTPNEDSNATNGGAVFVYDGEPVP